MTDPAPPPRLVRAHTIVGGRDRVAAAVLPIEALVEMTWPGWAARHTMAFERAEVLAIARRPVAVGEIAAGTALPLGLARAVVEGMTAEGHLRVRTGGHDAVVDDAVMQEVLEGLQRLVDDGDV